MSPIEKPTAMQTAAARPPADILIALSGVFELKCSKQGDTTQVHLNNCVQPYRLDCIPKLKLV